MNYNDLTPAKIIAATLVVPIIALLCSAICFIYFAIPMYVAQHPDFGNPYNIELASIICCLMWCEVGFDIYIAARVFYKAPSKKDNKKSYPLTSMIFSYLYSIYSFAVAYAYFSHRWPDSFSVLKPLSTIDSIYFSVITASSIGYGDITPRSDCIKLIVISQALVSLGYIIFLFSICSTHLKERLSVVQ
jgi:hypothetical protein